MIAVSGKLAVHDVHCAYCSNGVTVTVNMAKNFTSIAGRWLLHEPTT